MDKCFFVGFMAFSDFSVIYKLALWVNPTNVPEKDGNNMCGIDLKAKLISVLSKIHKLSGRFETCLLCDYTSQHKSEATVDQIKNMMRL